MVENGSKKDELDPTVDALAAKVPGLEMETYVFRGDTSVTVPVDRLLEVLKVLRDDLGYSLLVDMAGLHYPKRQLAFEIAYVLRSVEPPKRFRVKTQVTDGAKAPSLTGLFSAANWHEREVYDMFGIEFEGHPDLTRIFLPDDFGDHPLRKEFPLKGRD